MHWPLFSPQWDSKQKCVPGLFSWADVTPVRLAPQGTGQTLCSARPCSLNSQKRGLASLSSTSSSSLKISQSLYPSLSLVPKGWWVGHYQLKEPA